jgi:hypothetical protein
MTSWTSPRRAAVSKLEPTHPWPQPDYAAEEFEWPEVSELRPADAARLLDDIEREATAANKRADRLKERKAQAKAIVGMVLEEYDQEDVTFRNQDGRKVRYTPYEFTAYRVNDDTAFREWAADEGERFYDERLRDGVFRDEMHRRYQDGEPLPPGVLRYTETRYSRSAIKD